MSEKTLDRLLAGLVFTVSLTVYLMTMAATVSFWDSGEFIATSYILGIPHSPGTPLYVLVGRVFCLLPLAISTARKVNLLSALPAALGVLMAYIVMSRVARIIFAGAKNAAGSFARLVGPLVGSLFLAFSDTYWTDASEAEVYALSAFVMGLCTVLALRWLEAGKERPKHLILLIIYLLSLGIGFHLGTILVYGGIFLMILMVGDKEIGNSELIVFTIGFAVVVADMTLYRRSDITIAGLAVFALLVIWSTARGGRFAITASALFILGISVHLFLYIRSGLNPAIDEVDPQTWKALYAHLRREQYPPIDIFSRKAPIIFQLQHFGAYFREQFRLFGDIMLGRFNLGKASVLVPAALGLIGIMVNFNRGKRTWVLNFTNLALNSIGLIIFLNFSDSEVRERDYFYGGAFYFFSIFIGIGATSLLLMIAGQFKESSRKVMRIVVPAGLLLVAFSLLPARYHWYRHDRSDDYIPRNYAFNILAGLEPDAVIFTNGDNDTFPLWYIQYVEGYRKDVRVANLSLLNTPWYIKQVRDTEPRVPLELSDEEIDMLKPFRVEDGIVWVKDLAVNQIIRAAGWRRPVYFSVTVPNEVWSPYSENLELEGMVRKLVPAKGRFLVNDFMIERNMKDVFEFGGILTADGRPDDTVYKSSDVRNMFVNYSIAAFQVAQKAARDNDFGKAVRWGEMSYAFAPGFEWPKKYLGPYYMQNRQYAEAVEHYKRILRADPGRGDFWVGLAAAYEELEQYGLALEALKTGAVSSPDHRDIYGHGFRVAASIGLKGEAESFVREWLEIHPEDREFSSLLENIDRILLEDFGIGAGKENGAEGE